MELTLSNTPLVGTSFDPLTLGDLNVQPLALQAGAPALSLTQVSLPEGWLDTLLANLQQGTPIAIGPMSGDALVSLSQVNLPDGWLENVLAHVTAGDLTALAQSPIAALALSLSQGALPTDVQLVGVPHAIEGAVHVVA